MNFNQVIDDDLIKATVEPDGRIKGEWLSSSPIAGLVDPARSYAFTFSERYTFNPLLKLSTPDDEGGRVLTVNKRDATFSLVSETEDQIVFRIVPKK